MKLQVNVAKVEDLPEFARAYAEVDSDGKVMLDFDKSFSALQTERNEHRATKQALAAFKELGDVSAIRRFVDLGKSPDELAEMIEQSTANAKNAKNGDDAERQRLLIDKLTKKVADLEKTAAERERVIADGNLRKAVEKLIDGLPQDIDRELARSYALGGTTANGAPVGGNYASIFKMNALNELEDIGGKSAGEYFADACRSLRFVKSSTAGSAAAGNSAIPNGGNAAFNAAREKGDIGAMIANAPTETI